MVTLKMIQTIVYKISWIAAGHFKSFELSSKQRITESYSFIFFKRNNFTVSFISVAHFLVYTIGLICPVVGFYEPLYNELTLFDFKLRIFNHFPKKLLVMVKHKQNSSC